MQYGPGFRLNPETGSLGGRCGVGSTRRMERELEAHATVAAMRALVGVAMADDPAAGEQLLKGRCDGCRETRVWYMQ